MNLRKDHYHTDPRSYPVNCETSCSRYLLTSLKKTFIFVPAAAAAAAAAAAMSYVVGMVVAAAAAW